MVTRKECQFLNKRVEGTFADFTDIKDAINQMLGQGYASKQLLVVTRNKYGKQLQDETTVEVMLTNDNGESLWDRIVDFFTIDLDDDDNDDEIDEEDVFEDYGIDENTYERFEEALENGEYLLLIDDAPPAQQEHSQYLVRDGIIPEEEPDMTKNNKVNPDWVESDESVKGDVEKHSVEAGKKAEHPHPDPQPGEKADDNVKEPIPQSQHPDPPVDGDDEEIGSSDEDDDAPTEAEENPDLKEDTTGQPIVAPDPEGDPTMADDNQKLDEMQVDAPESHPAEDEDGFQVSKDPFGGNTEPVDKKDGGEKIDPEYEETE